MNYAGQCLNIARQVHAHEQAYSYGECRDSEQALLASLSAWLGNLGFIALKGKVSDCEADIYFSWRDT